MRTVRLRRRGVMLVLVVIVMTVVGGLLTMLAASAASRYRQRQAGHVRLVARAVADSAADYARLHLGTWRQRPPDEPVQLDISELLPSEMTGTATITVTTGDERADCRISTHVSRGIYAASEDRQVPVQ